MSGFNQFSTDTFALPLWQHSQRCESELNGIANVQFRKKNMPDERPCPIEKPGKIMPAENKAEGIPYSIKYSDLDINGHFNSVKYIEHLLDLFDIDQFKTREIGRLEIAYQSEGKQGMPLTLHKAESAPDKQDMAICHEGKAICRAAVTWR